MSNDVRGARSAFLTFLEDLFMQKKILVDLLHDVEQEMLRLGYTEGSMQFYRRRWQMLLQFATECGEVFYSEELGIAFVEKHFNISKEDFDRTLSQSATQELRIIRLIGDFQLHHTILRRCTNHKELLTDPYFIEISNQFKSYCQGKEYSTVTTDHYVKQSARFMDYLVSQHVTNCKEISVPLIQAYIKTLAGYTYKTVEQNICSIRTFFRFLLEKEEVYIDFAAKTPMVQARKKTRIPSVWTKDELKQLLAVIDRGSPKGKRDYAIILLACFLGLRCIDIKNLRMTDFHWEEKKLVFTQSKTKMMLALPLTPEVGWAIIDYLKYGRPNVESPYLFIRHLAPFLPFSEADHLSQLIKRYMEQAHIPTLKKKRGMHSLRHTLASMLLEKETPLPIISDILGHMDTDSTGIYLKVDLQKLKECALTFEGVSHD
jgi:site-specific recombinase XerD